MSAKFVAAMEYCGFGCAFLVLISYWPAFADDGFISAFKNSRQSLC
jgi:uncharacterized protein YutD